MAERSESSGSTSQEDPDDYPALTGQELYIYAIRERDTDNYKVGHTKNLAARLRNLSTGNPRRLIFKIVKRVNDQKWEKFVHDHLKPYHIKQRGGTEWFEIAKEHKAVICNVFDEVPSSLP